MFPHWACFCLFIHWFICLALYWCSKFWDHLLAVWLAATIWQTSAAAQIRWIQMICDVTMFVIRCGVWTNDITDWWLSKQLGGRWFKVPSCSLWRHNNAFCSFEDVIKYLTHLGYEYTVYSYNVSFEVCNNACTVCLLKCASLSVYISLYLESALNSAKVVICL